MCYGEKSYYLGRGTESFGQCNLNRIRFTESLREKMALNKNKVSDRMNFEKNCEMEFRQRGK